MERSRLEKTKGDLVLINSNYGEHLEEFVEGMAGINQRLYFYGKLYNVERSIIRHGTGNQLPSEQSIYKP